MLATGIVTLSALTPQAEAAVIWTFGQNGADVTATASGTFTIDVIGSQSSYSSASPGTSSRSDGYFTHSGTFGMSRGGVGAPVHIPSTLTSAPDSWTGNFGHSSRTIRWGTEFGSTLSKSRDVSAYNATITYNDTTIDTIFGGGFFDNGPVHAWTLSGGATTDTISYVAAVPEPSSSLLIGLGAFGLLARRKR